jgi:hypothetical protein
MTVTILDIINRPVFYLKYEISETEFYFGRQVDHLSWAQLIELTSVSGHQ